MALVFPLLLTALHFHSTVYFQIARISASFVVCTDHRALAGTFSIAQAVDHLYRGGAKTLTFDNGNQKKE